VSSHRRKSGEICAQFLRGLRHPMKNTPESPRLKPGSLSADHRALKRAATPGCSIQSSATRPESTVCKSRLRFRPPA
jgi:hypothetical protein